MCGFVSKNVPPSMLDSLYFEMIHHILPLKSGLIQQMKMNLEDLDDELSGNETPILFTFVIDTEDHGKQLVFSLVCSVTKIRRC